MILRSWLLLASLWISVFAAEVRGEALSWHASLPDALAEARATGKPLFLEFRCAPCVNGREFDAQVFYTDSDSPRGKLMSQYVLARVTSMSGVNIAHYDRDWHNSLYYFVVNGNEDIYLRYGGRDEAAADTYLNLESLELALELGLSEHAKYLAGERPSEEKPEVFQPKDISLLDQNVIQKNRCTECHLIADYSMQEKALAGLLDPITDLYRSPNIQNLGLHLDIPKGLLVEKVTGAASDAGVLPADVVVSLNGSPVLTFGDLQYALDGVSRFANGVNLGVKRDGEILDVRVKLPHEWWKTDLEFRHWTVEPQLFFEMRSLEPEEKAGLKLPEDGFAAEVTGIDIEAVLNGHHSLEIGDVIVAVDGKNSNPVTSDLVAYIKIFHPANGTLELSVLRSGEPAVVQLKTSQQNFRKAPIEDVAPELSLAWSTPAYLTSGNEKAVAYSAAVANGYLLVQAKHFADWHSFTMDNPQRSIGKLGEKGNQELPTGIVVDQETEGAWLQTGPTDFSKPDIRWYTWGFQGVSYFAVKLSDPGKQVNLKVSAQACRADICAGAVDLELEVPATSAGEMNPAAAKLIGSLKPVLPKAD